MSSIIKGYEYDIFISYRQKDNKHDGWVTEFVDNLKGELESTFKEDISIYFDENQHDGLLDTHDVDASLKDKLKCLVFIPILSRTYCDPKSFAWEHEFKAFVELASQDQFGLKVKLPNGNVASRILPVRIHDLDIADIRQCESVLGSVLRGIEFIYKEPGANKPLTSDDDENKNLNKTRYKVQINKVAIAIKEIILGLKTKPVLVVKEKTSDMKSPEEVKEVQRLEGQEKTTKLSKRNILSGGIVLAVLLVIMAILGYPKIFKRDTLEKLRSSGERISVAVLPFQNMTNDTTWNVWQNGIQTNLIASLSNYSDELKVRQTESINNLLQSKGLTNYASMTPSLAGTVSQKLEASIFIYGSINKVGPVIRLNAQLIDSKTEEVFKSFQIDGKSDKILSIIDSLSVMIKDFLIISKLGKEVPRDFKSLVSTNSPEAYKYFIYGNNAYLKRDFSTAIKMYSQAIDIDSNFIFATIQLSIAYHIIGSSDQAKKWCLRVYKKRDQMPLQQKIWTNRIYAQCFETPYEQIMYLKQLQEFDDQVPVFYYDLGRNYNELDQYSKAIPEFEKALYIYNKWDSKPMWAYNYILLGEAYHMTGQYKKEKELYKKAEHDFPNDNEIFYEQAILSLTEKDSVAANQYIGKCLSDYKDNSDFELIKSNFLANIFTEAGLFDQAEVCYQKVLILQPDNPYLMNSFGFFLIDKNRNINEGLELVNKALKQSPNNLYFLDTKGWGLYKKGEYQEALRFLEKCDSLKPVYNHELYLHLEAAKKAVATQKKN